MNNPLTQVAIEAALAADLGGGVAASLGAAGWTWQGDALVKTFAFADFRTALAWMVRVGFEAEALNHHPEWTNVYGRVDVRLNTHDAGGKVTAKDVELARQMEAAVGSRR
jgi:4a-hydroxytetrahydrobiopterin dehydratase